MCFCLFALGKQCAFTFRGEGAGSAASMPQPGVCKGSSDCCCLLDACPLASLPQAGVVSQPDPLLRE